jgi:ABC-type lipoprotein release transport system permease subunit
MVIIFGLITLTSAFVASIIPGRSASRIPPSDALRYVG